VVSFCKHDFSKTCSDLHITAPSHWEWSLGWFLLFSFLSFNNMHEKHLINLVQDTQAGSADEIEANLIVWGSKAELPFAAVGDPASDYTTGGIFGVINGCGPRLKSSARPYKGTAQPTSLCSAVDAPGNDKHSQGCFNAVTKRVETMSRRSS
jgi:hypothetical protein